MARTSLVSFMLVTTSTKTISASTAPRIAHDWPILPARHRKATVSPKIHKHEQWADVCGRACGDVVGVEVAVHRRAELARAVDDRAHLQPSIRRTALVHSF